MDRIINIKVNGNHISKDHKNAGVKGEANVAILRITFDVGWDVYTKKVTFWDARGFNPVVIDLLPHLAENETTYLVPIPAEPMSEAGELTFVIDGTVDDKVQRSVSDKLEVKDAPIAKNAGQPVPPTENELTQLMGEIEKIKDDVLITREATEATQTYRNEAMQSADNAEQSASKAKQNADKAVESVGKTSYIGDNGNWFAWDSVQSCFYDTGVKAQAGSEVYLGKTPPESADVWIDPEGDGDATLEKILQTVNEKLSNLQEKVDVLYAKSLVKTATINLLSSAWIKESDNKYSQIVSIPDVTERSKVDLQPTVEQLLTFYEKDVSFVAENDDGVVTIYCIGQKPINDYSMQATITEVDENA